MSEKTSDDLMYAVHLICAARAVAGRAELAAEMQALAETVRQLRRADG